MIGSEKVPQRHELQYDSQIHHQNREQEKEIREKSRATTIKVGKLVYRTQTHINTTTPNHPSISSCLLYTDLIPYKCFQPHSRYTPLMLDGNLWLIFYLLILFCCEQKCVYVVRLPARINFILNIERNGFFIRIDTMDNASI